MSLRPITRTARLLTGAMVAALVSLLIGACGGSSSSSSSSNGVAAKSADDIVSAAIAAADGARSVHVAGAGTSSGSPINFDLHLVAGQGGRGQLAESGLSFQLIRLGGTVYINGGPAFWRHFGGAAAAQLFLGKWLKAPATGSDFAAVASLTDIHKLFSAAVNQHGKLAKGATTTIRGQKVVGVTDTTKGGTLYVATTGKPYPIEIAKSGTEGGQLVFDHWDESVSLSAPKDAIDVSQLQATK